MPGAGVVIGSATPATTQDDYSVWADLLRDKYGISYPETDDTGDDYSDDHEDGERNPGGQFLG